MPFKAIIFDFGNVLVAWNPYALFQRFFPQGKQAVDDFLEEIHFMEWNLEQDRGRPFADGIAQHSEIFPQYAHILAAYDKHWEDAIVGPIDGSVDILRQLKQAGYRLYGLSNHSAEKLPVTLRKFEFLGWLDDMVISGQVGLLKPDRAIFNLLLDKTGHSPEECIFVDDLVENVAAARQLGMAGIQFQSPQQLERELHEYGIL